MRTQQQEFRNNVTNCSRAGVSRSATIVIGYLMWKKKWKVKKAMKYVKKKREVVHPNSGFLLQLKMFEKALFLPIEDHRLDTLSPIDAIGVKLSLLPGMAQYRLCRLSVELKGYFIMQRLCYLTNIM